ncbi:MULTISPECIES: helix-turn-helix domain-containing protein [Pseudotamlana]|uniref:XRE family transcriptional regulator n=1 Tax=Pseudotamlana carrageenivorans TaxID=2069432 RepID=A0A2I7SGU5_9FLAO|nr:MULTISPECIES: helix-turn-helix transcriptional regulator [Tamlana]AUS05127.1 XRE family transcriptional regulator [Tamlana carrageenivorans]
MTDTEKAYLQSIGRNISTIRRQKNLSQLDVCAIIEMEKPNLSAIENGRQNVTALTLKKIADAIEVKVADFFIFKA